MRIGFRHCDPRFPFLWTSERQPAARWHGDGDGPANYFADTPTGAWAEFLRHEGITDAADLAGVRRSLWAVELPETDWAAPALAEATLHGDESSYPACRREAARLRAQGAERIEAHGAALLPGAAHGWNAGAVGHRPSVTPRDGRVWVVYGVQPLTGWAAVHSGSPPPEVLPLVRHLL
jgi:hypothetical protein